MDAASVVLIVLAAIAVTGAVLFVLAAALQQVRGRRLPRFPLPRLLRKPSREFQPRGDDRRRNEVRVVFPARINGQLVKEDRRKEERRKAPDDSR